MNPHRSFIEDQVSQAEEALQTIQDHLGRDNRVEGRIRFPRGFIRRVDPLIKTLPNIGTMTQRRNVAYSLMMTDVLRWLAVRTDLSSVALSMVVKHAIVLLGGICEWMAKEGTKGYSSGRSYKAWTKKLVDLGVISTALKDELDWLWDIRCNIHIDKPAELEHEKYSREDYNRALRAYNGLRAALCKVRGPAA